MLGRREQDQGEFFHEFHLDAVVPPDHLVRRIDRVLDTSWVHRELEPFYSHTGRPSVDPELMIRMLIVGYVFAIRSERRLCEEVQVNLAYRWFCGLGIEPHVPVWDKPSRRDGTFSRADFTYDPQADRYICPEGKILKTTGAVHDGRTRLYRARKADCDGCALKRRCCPKAPQRKVPRDIDEAVRDRVRGLANTPAFEQSRRERKKVEMAFAHIKRILKLDRLRLRGLTGAKFEVLFAATALNLKKLARYAGPSPPAPCAA